MGKKLFISQNAINLHGKRIICSCMYTTAFEFKRRQIESLHVYIGKKRYRNLRIEYFKDFESN